MKNFKQKNKINKIIIAKGKKHVESLRQLVDTFYFLKWSTKYTYPWLWLGIFVCDLSTSESFFTSDDGIGGDVVGI